MKDEPNYLNDPGGRKKAADPVRPEGRRSFLWLMAFFTVLFLIAIVIWVRYIFTTLEQTVGDGRNVETYQFDLSNFTGDKSVLVASGAPKDNLQAIANPTMIPAAQEDEAAKGWSRVVTSDDIVIGIVIDGEARAYPIRYLQWHEIVNDTIGPQKAPVAVTYNKLCDSAVVFDRRVGDATLTFGYSGLLYNSNLLMYDDQATNKAESLWSQLGFKAMSGPMAGTELTVLPMYFGTWGEWVGRHPQTLVWGGESRFRQRYNKRVILPGYFERGELKFPVKPLPPEGSPLEWMDRVAVLGGEGDWRVTPLAEGEWITDVNDAAAHACWFAWYAFHGGDGLVAPAAEPTPGKPGG